MIYGGERERSSPALCTLIKQGKGSRKSIWLDAENLDLRLRGKVR
jgi:hypothetical protein